MRRTAAAILALALAAPAWGEPTLVEAVRSGDRAAARALIAKGADVNEPAPDGATALLWAVHNDDAELVRALIAAKADVKRKNEFGASAIQEAAVNGNVEVLKALLDAGADANVATPEGQTPLMVIARTANVEGAKLLLAHGANVNAREVIENQTALIWAIDRNQPEMAKLLVANGADVNARTKAHEPEVRVSAEPRVRYEPSGGLTPLLYAAREGCLACARSLLEAGAKIDAYEPDGVTPLIMAITNAHFDLAAYLIGKGADVNRWDWWGRSPLYAAVDYNTIPRGGRADRPALDDATPLQMIEILLKAGANPNLQLKFPPPFRDVGADRGGDLMLTTGATPLLRAAKAGDAAAVKLLLAAGARTDLSVARAWKDNVGGVTPLMAAAGLGYQLNDTRGKLKTEAQAIETIKLLLAAGADINARDDRGHTALFGAVFRGWTEVARFLVENGAKLDAKNNDGVTLMDVAKGKMEVFRGQTIDSNPDMAPLLERLTAGRAP
jgi:ankyrin repeat protein